MSRETEDWTEVIRPFTGKSHSEKWIRAKAKHVEVIHQQWVESQRSLSQTLMLQSMISLLLSMQEQLQGIEEQMRRLAKEMPEVELIKSIPGLGDKLAAAIISEIGNAKQFEEPKQLVAFAGLDPSVHSSGQFTASRNRISKRGSKRLRRALFLAVQCGLRRSCNTRLKAYYDKKRQEGKPCKVTVIACANKLLHHIYAILKKGQPYQA